MNGQETTAFEKANPRHRARKIVNFILKAALCQSNGRIIKILLIRVTGVSRVLGLDFDGQTSQVLPKAEGEVGSLGQIEK